MADQGSCELIFNSDLCWPVIAGKQHGWSRIMWTDFNRVTCTDLWLQVNSTADQGSCELIVDSIQLESSPSVLSSIETVTNLVLLVLPSVRRSTKSQKVDRDSAVTHSMCVQATNINVFLCCENSGQWIITTYIDGYCLRLTLLVGYFLCDSREVLIFILWLMALIRGC